MDVGWCSAPNQWFYDPDRLNNNNNSGQSLTSMYKNDLDLLQSAQRDLGSNKDLGTTSCALGIRSSWALSLTNLNNFPMLDLLETKSKVSSPMDFTPYLIEAGALPDSSQSEENKVNPTISSTDIGFNFSMFTNAATLHSNSHNICHTNQSNKNVSNLNVRRNGPLKPIIIKSDSCSDSVPDNCLDNVSSAGNTAVNPVSPGRILKKVSFADHKGLALAQVRFVKECSDEPPHLNPEILSSLTEGASAEVVSKPPLNLCFLQPASDYLLFRDKVNSNLVMLENVILRDYTLEGTIKVKNVTFEKNVFVRLSLDEWQTFKDFQATYIPGPETSTPACFDTFSFNIDIPPRFDVTKRIQFAICFEENGHQHWDSNGGKNYCIVSEHYKSSKSSDSENQKDSRQQWGFKQSSESLLNQSLSDIFTSIPYY